MNSNKRYLGLRTVMSLGLVAVGVIASGFVSYFLYTSYSFQIREDLRQRLINISDIVALQLNPESLSTINGEADMQNEAYTNYQDFFFNVIEKEEDIIYIYTMRKAEDDNIYFFLDAGRDPTREEYEPGIPGIDAYEEPSDLLIKIFLEPGKTVAEEGIYTDEFGSVISAYTPIYNADGTLLSILGVDISADTVLAQEQNVINQTLLYFLISLPLIAVIGLLLGNRFSRPTIALKDAANEIVGGNIHSIKSIPSPSLETHQLMIAFNAMTNRLRELINNLEANVKDRTAQLEIANQQVTRRASQFEAIANTARSAATAQNLEQLLPAISSDISVRFDFYHVGIFLLDPNKEYAILSAANSHGGKNMLARGHRLKVGEQGIVGYATSSGNPRIALDVGEDAVFFNNPDLPDTHSEVALPLRFGHEIIGALDIQSTESNAFSQDDVEIFSVLADQVSVAIQNTRSLEQAQQALHDAEFATRNATGQTWEGFTEKVKIKGYRYDGVKPEPLQKASITKDQKDAHSVPVQLRGQTIGRLKLRASDPSHKWTDDELAIVEATAERVAIALEGARLLEDAQKRASRETFLSEIAAKLGASFQLDSILRDTVEELGQTLKGSKVTFQLVNPSSPPAEDNPNGGSTRGKKSE